jgi:AcrR family transcriptional regulator
MSARLKLTPDETRERILATAEEHFRRVGYAKTAVADIAAELRMSPANVYRFFPSKGAIVEAICQKLLGESHRMIDAIASEDAPAADRIERIVLELHRYNKRTYTAERRMHDMVAVAMEENWGAIEAHFAMIVSVIAGCVADGVRRGEFPPQDVPLAALTVKNCLASVMHPALIASCAHMDLDNQAVRVARFAVAALRQGPRLPAPASAPFPLPSAE